MNIALLLNFVRQDLVDRYSGSLLGRGWAFMMPLIQILIFVFIFSQVMGAKLESLGSDLSGYAYSIYLISGILGWNALSNTIARVSSIYQDKASLIGKVDLSLVTLPLYIVLTEAVVFAISWLIFLLFLAVIGAFPGGLLIWLPVIFVVQQLLAYAIGFFCAVFSVLLRDVRELVTVGLQLWFWLTPVVYVVGILPDHLRAVFLLNPVVPVMNAYRAIILQQQAPDLVSLALVSLFAGGLLAVGIWLFKRLERDIRDLI